MCRPPLCVPSRSRVRAYGVPSRLAATVRSRTRVHPEPLSSRPPFTSQCLALLARSAAPLFGRCALVRRPPACPLRRSLSGESASVAALPLRGLAVAALLCGFHRNHAVGGLVTPRPVSRVPLLRAPAAGRRAARRRAHALCTSVGARESARPSTLSSCTLGLSRVSCHPPHLCIGMSRCSFVSSLTDPLYSRPNVSVTSVRRACAVVCGRSSKTCGPTTIELARLV